MSMNTPCNGEIQFWSVMRSQMTALVKQTTRIADALERQAKLQAKLQAGPQAPRVGDWVVWTDPETGETTGGWRVVRTQGYPDDPNGSGRDGVYYIERPDGSGAEVHPYEIAVCEPAQGGQ